MLEDIQFPQYVIGCMVQWFRRTMDNIKFICNENNKRERERYDLNLI